MTATECPVCTHSPFSADTATTAKALRTTVNVFLKTEAKKRGMDIKGDTLKPIAAPEPPPPVVETPLVDAAPTPGPVGDAEPSVAPAEVEEPAVNGEASPANALQVRRQLACRQDTRANMEQTGVEEITINGDAAHAVAKITDAEDDDDESDEDDVVITTEYPEVDEQHQQQQEQGHGQEQYHEQANNGGNHDQMMAMNQQQNFGGFDQNMATFNNGNNFGNMGMNGFNPMMGMMGMGMPNMMGKTSFPSSSSSYSRSSHRQQRRLRKAVGMPGMGMDPSMMFNGGFGGMGDMSAMMNMGAQVPQWA
jgi:hypothetical protein